MICPECKEQLPIIFALATEDKKVKCSTCKSELLPTAKSMSEIKLVTGTFSFVTGVPLGMYCFNLWVGNDQLGFALYFLLFGTGGVVSAVTLYSKMRMKFRQAWLAPAAGL